MNRIFRTRTFSRWMKRAGLTNADLCLAVTEMQRGLVDADLGGHLVKKRVALTGRGKRGGTRTIVATRFDKRWYFLYGFSKNDRENINKQELEFFRQVGRELLGLDSQQIENALTRGEIMEVCCGCDKEQKSNS